jgi:hypothetical protein
MLKVFFSAGDEVASVKSVTVAGSIRTPNQIHFAGWRLGFILDGPSRH